MVQPLPQDTGSLRSQAQGTFPVGGRCPHQHPLSALQDLGLQPLLYGGYGASGSHGTGCGRSRSAGWAGEGSESPLAFPARVGPPQPPSIPLHLPVTLGQHQAANKHSKTRFPDLRAPSPASGTARSPPPAGQNRCGAGSNGGPSLV